MSNNTFDISSLFGPPMRETCYGHVTQEQYEARRADDVLREVVRTACIRCVDAGYRANGLVCDHVDRIDMARRGSEKVRDALNARRQQETRHELTSPNRNQ